ncbi:MAG: heavy metal translocating P-type ATPase [Myxococcales bacterium]|nr:heavy metal translocating P-type ATPase [Myxococcales bacterium]MCB9543862.1 heavy metal translocating P-type ATPase [Myxococcales bacterium]
MPFPILPIVAGAVVFGLVNLGKKRLASPARRRHKKAKAPDEPGEKVDLTRLARDVGKVVFLSDRAELQASMDEASRAEAEAEDRHNKRQMALSAGAFGVAVASTFVAPLVPVAIGAVLFLMRDTAALVWRDIKRGHVLSLYAISAGVTLLMLASGYVALAAFAALMEGFFSRIINQLERSSKHHLTTAFAGDFDKVWIVKDGIEIQIPYPEVGIGDRVRVRAGELIPVDGRVVDGMAQVDQRILTGESQPVEKEPGDEVFASTLVLSGRVTVEVVTAGDDTVAARIARTLEGTQSYKDTVMLRGRAIADRFVPAKLALAGTAAVFVNPQAGLALMWAEMGTGLCISGPMSVMTYLQLLARQQILVKDGRVFEALSAVDTVVFDKTGTLTEEQPTLGAIHPFNGFDSDAVLRFAATAEQRQPHPIARAIRARAEAEGLEPLATDDGQYELGYGVTVSVGGRVIRVGSARFLTREGVTLPPSVEVIQAQAQAAAHTLVYLGVDGELAGVMEMEPTIRPEAREIVAALRELGIELYIISGDHEIPTRRMAEALGIQNYFAETLPENKAALIQRLRDEGRFVCFVGDGINDAIALQAAQVSVSLKGASTAATDTAQVVFMDGTLRHLPRLFEMVDEFEDSMRRNIVFGFAPGVFTIGGVLFFKFGIAAAMAVQYISIFGELVNVFWPLAKHQDAMPAPAGPDSLEAPESHPALHLSEPVGADR